MFFSALLVFLLVLFVSGVQAVECGVFWISQFALARGSVAYYRALLKMSVSAIALKSHNSASPLYFLALLSVATDAVLVDVPQGPSFRWCYWSIVFC